MTGSGSRSLGLHGVATALMTAAAVTLAPGVPLPPRRPPITTAPTVPLPPERPGAGDAPPQPPSGSQPAASVPLPPDKPPPGTGSVPPTPQPDLACAALLSGGTVEATAIPPIVESGGCGIAAPVRVAAIILRDGRHVPLSPPATMRCDLAASLAAWLREDVAPLTTADGDLLDVAAAAAYTCRTRNHLPGERLSEHASGNAIDILALRYTRRTVAISDAASKAFWAPLRTSACLRFTTVLGPGSDAFHATDLHLDLAHRRSGAHLCQWSTSSSDDESPVRKQNSGSMLLLSLFKGRATRLTGRSP